jgi:hypothetical protein
MAEAKVLIPVAVRVEAICPGQRTYSQAADDRVFSGVVRKVISPD